MSDPRPTDPTSLREAVASVDGVTFVGPAVDRPALYVSFSRSASAQAVIEVVALAAEAGCSVRPLSAGSPDPPTQVTPRLALEPPRSADAPEV